MSLSWWSCSLETPEEKSAAQRFRCMAVTFEARNGGPPQPRATAGFSTVPQSSERVGHRKLSVPERGPAWAAADGGAERSGIQRRLLEDQDILVIVPVALNVGLNADALVGFEAPQGIRWRGERNAIVALLVVRLRRSVIYPAEALFAIAGFCDGEPVVGQVFPFVVLNIWRMSSLQGDDRDSVGAERTREQGQGGLKFFLGEMREKGAAPDQVELGRKLELF